MTRLKLLRDLQSYPDDQIFLNWDKRVAEKHKLNFPFRCWNVIWSGGGVVRANFYSFLDSGEISSYFILKDLEPVEFVPTYDI